MSRHSGRVDVMNGGRHDGDYGTMIDEERELRLAIKRFRREVLSKYPQEQWEALINGLLDRLVASGQLPDVLEKPQETLTDRASEDPHILIARS